MSNMKDFFNKKKTTLKALVELTGVVGCFPVIYLKNWYIKDSTFRHNFFLSNLIFFKKPLEISVTQLNISQKWPSKKYQKFLIFLFSQLSKLTMTAVKKPFKSFN